MLIFVLTNLFYALGVTTLVILLAGLIAYVLAAISEKSWIPKKLEFDTFWGILIGVNITALLMTVMVSIPTWNDIQHDRNLVQSCSRVEVNGDDVILPTGEEIQIGITPEIFYDKVIIYNNGIPVGEYEDSTGNIWYVDRTIQPNDPLYYICKR